MDETRIKIDDARQIAARCWCDSRTSNRQMDPELAEVFAETLQSLLPALGYATTRDLLQEIEARFATGHPGGLDYRTVYGEETSLATLTTAC